MCSSDLIYSFWKVILNCPDEFCEWIEKIDVSISTWMKYREIQKNKDISDEFELAKSTFFLNRTNVSGIIKGGPIGGVTQNGKYKINARFNKNDLTERIKNIKCVASRIEISNLDGIKFLKKINNKNENIFIYLDPPYINKGSDLYMNFYSTKDHKNLSTAIKKIKKGWIVSYDNNDYILQLYGINKKIIYQLSQSASNRVGDEILIFSNTIECSNSINHLKSPEYCLDYQGAR